MFMIAFQVCMSSTVEDMIHNTDIPAIVNDRTFPVKKEEGKIVFLLHGVLNILS
jgi:hypothetical protein